MGLLDTGATYTCIHEALLVALGLQPINVIQMGTANGQVQRNIYAAKLNFPGLPWDVGLIGVVGVDLSGQQTPATHGQQSQPIVSLVGRDLLQACSFHWDGPTGLWSLSW